MKAVMNEETMTLEVTLSKRNLLALLTKLDMEDSACTIYTDEVYLKTDTSETAEPNWQFFWVKAAGRGEFYTRLVVTSEPDETHYADREPPGRMHLQTEVDIQAYENERKE